MYSICFKKENALSVVVPSSPKIHGIYVALVVNARKKKLEETQENGVKKILIGNI